MRKKNHLLFCVIIRYTSANHQRYPVVMTKKVKTAMRKRTPIKMRARMKKTRITKVKRSPCCVMESHLF